MKKTISLPLAVLMLFAVSCNKQASDLPKPDVKTSIKSSGKMIRIKVSMRPIWIDDGDQYYGCFGIGGNCLPEVVIICNPLQQVIHAIDNNVPGNIITIFENNQQEMADALASDDAVAGVINGELSLSIRGKTDAQTRYILFTDNSDGEIVEIVPVKSN